MTAQAKSQRQPNFDLLARPYLWLEHLTLGRALQRCRTHFLHAMHDRRQALVLGDGDGRFLAALLAANAGVHADAVDISRAMLRQLSLRAHTAAEDAGARLRTHHTSALAFSPSRNAAPCDLVVTHFFLDCLTQPEVDTLAARIVPHLAPGALWLVSDFRIPDGAMRLPARALVRLLYVAFRLLTGLRVTRLPDHAAALSRAGFTRTAHHESLAGILTTEIWALKPPSAADPALPQLASAEYTP